LTSTTPGRRRRGSRRSDPRYPRILLGAAIAAVSIGGGAASAQTVSEPDPADALEPPAGEPTEDAVAPSHDAVTGQADAGPDETAGTTDGTGTDEVDDAVEGSEETGDNGDTATGDEGGTGAGGAEGRDLARRPRRGGGAAKLKLQRAAPRRVIYRGTREAVFRFEIGGRRTRDLRVQLLRKGSRRVIRGWGKQDVEPGKVRTVAWTGARRRGGEPPKGVYYFRVVQRNGEILDRRRAEGDRTVRLYPHKFPLRARHDYWDGWGAGRGHKGQDLGARCGAKLVAARAGRVQWKAYQGSGAGYYVVIDGKRTRLDYVYMHLRKPAVVSRGERVKAGRRIGAVGESGNASGCHLHFELWKGDWYGGGHAMRKVTRYLRRWDRWT
jgi:murein DD-endopeptidase MepM/ murein hydrolase activator NlpD